MTWRRRDEASPGTRGAQESLGSAGVSFADLGAVVHGTTLVTNAIIERNGCPPGLLTTCGFRDILEMGSEQRYHIYDLFAGGGFDGGSPMRMRVSE